MATINLGDRVEDQITGYKGVVIAKTFWLYGCVRVIVQGEDMKDGRPVEAATFDEPQVKRLKKSVIDNIPAYSAFDQQPIAVGAPHGHRPDAERRPTATRR